MSLPAITRKSVLWALSRIDREGVPGGRQSTKYCLIYDDRHYPPKYVYALAAECETGSALSPGDYSGGEQTNKPLRELGFTIKECKVLPRVISSTRRIPAIGRLIVIRNSPGTPTAAEEMLLKAFSCWPKWFAADFLITPGGFLQCELSGDVPERTSWDSDKKDFPHLRKTAETFVKRVISSRLLAAATGKAKFLTIGIDLANANGTFVAELIAVINLCSGRIIRWTGKSYPTSEQERALWQVTDLESHCVNIAGYRVLVLGCHDLNMFSNRAWTNQKKGSLRRRRTTAMRRVAKHFGPDVILHHPHRTDSANIWGTAWSGAKELFNPIAWASGILYEDNRSPRMPLEAVRDGTRAHNGPFCDIILCPGKRLPEIWTVSHA